MTRDVETCARCGHESRGCSKCGVYHRFLGGRVREGLRLCHTFSRGRPTCYELETRVTGNASWWGPPC